MPSAPSSFFRRFPARAACCSSFSSRSPPFLTAAVLFFGEGNLFLSFCIGLLRILDYLGFVGETRI
ncbi:C2 calcium/lipid-binding plant phosphoribosyltransferase family protein [Perilla frutescens var. hirtella]|nr:C2 calcium/lipid-binding plant phosphoribosyltransferase family protein [Perilla frutescens var. hirtella]KAH6817331.1 C2 calcium/lipid-binding plant phosphoribosyltransferase family protein [Perilla frutescens var. frutescens]